MDQLVVLFEKEMEIKNLELDMILNIAPSLMVESEDNIISKATEKIKDLIDRIVKFIKDFFHSKEYNLKMEQIEKMFEYEPKLKNVEIEAIDYLKAIDTIQKYMININRTKKSDELILLDNRIGRVYNRESRTTKKMKIIDLFNDLKKLDKVSKSIESWKNISTLDYTAKVLGSKKDETAFLLYKYKICQKYIGYCESCVKNHIGQISIINKALNEEASKRHLKKANKS